MEPVVNLTTLGGLKKSANLSDVANQQAALNAITNAAASAVSGSESGGAAFPASIVVMLSTGWAWSSADWTGRSM